MLSYRSSQHSTENNDAEEWKMISKNTQRCMHWSCLQLRAPAVQHLWKYSIAYDLDPTPYQTQTASIWIDDCRSSPTQFPETFPRYSWHRSWSHWLAADVHNTILEHCCLDSISCSATVHCTRAACLTYFRQRFHPTRALPPLAQWKCQTPLSGNTHEHIDTQDGNGLAKFFAIERSNTVAIAYNKYIMDTFVHQWLTCNRSCILTSQFQLNEEKQPRPCTAKMVPRLTVIVLHRCNLWSHIIWLMDRCKRWIAGGAEGVQLALLVQALLLLESHTSLSPSYVAFLAIIRPSSLLEIFIVLLMPPNLRLLKATHLILRFHSNTMSYLCESLSGSCLVYCCGKGGRSLTDSEFVWFALPKDLFQIWINARKSYSEIALNGLSSIFGKGVDIHRTV